MADYGRLDELKRKFDENPRRYFAPLANEYRKAGDTERAIELCRSYLPQQPGHMSGYIVYGQALFDAGRFNDAHEVFKQALSIDPENIIALRYLGDIARQAGDRAAAMQWYGKVLELDPKNEEVASHITGLAAPEQHAASASPKLPAMRPEPEPSADAVALEELVQEPDEPRVSTPMRPAWEQSVEPPASLEFGPEVHDETHDDDMAASPSVESAAVEPPVFEGVTWQDEDIDPAPPHDEFLVPTDEPLAGAEPAWVEPRPVEPTFTEPAPSVPTEPAAIEPESPFVTETMAELYWQQGFTAEALAVYRRLTATRNDPRLFQRMQEIEAALESASPEREPRSEPEPEAELPVSASRTLAEPAGPTVREFFARIGARQPAPTEIVSPAATPRVDSLSALFDRTSLDEHDVRAAASLGGAFSRGA